MPDSKTDTNYERMAKVIAITPYMKHLGMEFIEGREGYAKLRLRFQKENTTAGDALHGGAIASLIDTTGAMAAWTTAEILSSRYFGSTVGVNVNYLSGVIGEDAFAEGPPEPSANPDGIDFNEYVPPESAPPDEFIPEAQLVGAGPPPPSRTSDGTGLPPVTSSGAS